MCIRVCLVYIFLLNENNANYDWTLIEFCCIVIVTRKWSRIHLLNTILFYGNTTDVVACRALREKSISVKKRTAFSRYLDKLLIRLNQAHRFARLIAPYDLPVRVVKYKSLMSLASVALTFLSSITSVDRELSFSQITNRPAGSVQIMP